MTKPSEIKRRWKYDRERGIRKAQRAIIDALEPLGEDGARRVMRVIVACNNAGCLDDLGSILSQPKP